MAEVVVIARPKTQADTLEVHRFSVNTDDDGDNNGGESTAGVISRRCADEVHRVPDLSNDFYFNNLGTRVAIVQSTQRTLIQVWDCDNPLTAVATLVHDELSAEAYRFPEPFIEMIRFSRSDNYLLSISIVKGIIIWDIPTATAVFYGVLSEGFIPPAPFGMDHFLVACENKGVVGSNYCSFFCSCGPSSSQNWGPRLFPDKHRVTWFCVSSDAKFLAAEYYPLIKIWDLASQSSVPVCVSHLHFAAAPILFCKNGSRIGLCC